MSIRDPMKWFREKQLGTDFDTITLRVKDYQHQIGPAFTVDTFTIGNNHSYNAVIDWLEKSPVYVWPYAKLDYRPDSLRDVIVTLIIDCAAVGAISVNGNDTGTSYTLGEDVARVLSALSGHVYKQTRGTIFINVPK